MKKEIALVVVTLFIFFSCKKSTNQPPVMNKKASDIYVIGDVIANVHDVAAYWKNGLLVTLVDSLNNSNSYATAIAISDTNVYIAGNIDGSSSSVLYWKNGKEQIIATGSPLTEHANSIAVNGNDVYIVGYSQSPQKINTILLATYWKNGNPVILSNSRSSATGIAFINNDIYVSGDTINASGNAVNIVWKNGLPTKLNSTSFFYFFSGIATNASDIYLIGSSNKTSGSHGVATFWKNGAETLLGDTLSTSHADAIKIVNNDVYIAGVLTNGNNNSIVYWKNGTLTTINPNGLINSNTALAVDGTDIYLSNTIIGNSRFNAEYWKNGVATLLPGKIPEALGIAVMPH